MSTFSHYSNHSLLVASIYLVLIIVVNRGRCCDSDISDRLYLVLSVEEENKEAEEIEPDCALKF